MGMIAKEPNMDEGEKSVTIRIPMALWRWLGEQPGGKTGTIIEALEERRRRSS